MSWGWATLILRSVERRPLTTGNPGTPEYYLYFLGHLHSNLPDGHALLAASHVGGDPAQPHPKKPFDLPDQIASKIEMVNALQSSLDAWASSGPKPKVALAGHSAGTWVICEMMKKIKVHAAYLMFPTLGWIAWSYNGWTMWPMFHFPILQIIPWTSYLARPLLPYYRLPKPSQELVKSPETLRDVLAMAVSEMKLIREPDYEWFLKQRELPRGEGVHGVWSEGNLDGWVGKEAPMIRDCLGKDRACTVDIPHAFCLSERKSQRVADIVTGWILDEPAKTAAALKNANATAHTGTDTPDYPESEMIM